MDNPFIESCNGRRRDELLNVELFFSIPDAQHKLLEWQRDYNESRPHRSMGNIPPREFATQWHSTQPVAGDISTSKRSSFSGQVPRGKAAMGISRFCLLLGCVLLASACTSIVEIRTEHSAVSVKSLGAEQLKNCVTGYRAPNEPVNSLEDYGDFLIGYVEFDDQGWLYPTKKTGQLNQIRGLVQRMRDDLARPEYRDTNFVTLVFIHGWHHNAHDNDCNVNEFRAMVERTREILVHQRPDGKAWRVVGVYVGWRGEAIDIPVLKYATILDRRYTAEHVAKGSVRELFAELRQLEMEHPGSGDGRMRTIIIGHSFGGLIVFNALSQAVVNGLVSAKPKLLPTSSTGTDCEPSKSTGLPLWPDQIVLINPAFEASRFEALHHAARLDPGCHYRQDRPNLLSVTADNDWATGTAYTAFRWVGTLFEGYNDMSSSAEDDVERDANHHTVGFVKRYQTHRLSLKTDGRRSYVESKFEPPAGTDIEVDPNTPLWVVRAPSEIIEGHDGFLYSRHAGEMIPKPYLLDWLLCLYLSHGDVPLSEQCQRDVGGR